MPYFFMRQDHGMKRLDSVIRARGYASRREVRQLVSEGRIRVDGEKCSDPAMRIGEDAAIEIDGVLIENRPSVTLMLNKPAGYVCTRDSDLYPTVFSLLKGEYAERSLFAVGRLDADTEGLLILTNDGELCDRILRPESGIQKTYEVSFDRPLCEGAAEMLRGGVSLPEGVRCRPAYLSPTGERSARITVCEGKYHEVKRLIRACGAQVSTLRRVAIGALSLDEALKTAEYRELSAQEISLLYEKNMLR